MRLVTIIILFVLTACGGSLTEEQRKKVKEEMANGTIRKITEAQILEEAFSLGRSTARRLQTGTPDIGLYDSLKRLGISFTRMNKGDTTRFSLETEILKAYVSAAATMDEPGDNVQKSGKDTLLFTKAYFKTEKSGKRDLDYALIVRFPKRSIVQSIKD